MADRAAPVSIRAVALRVAALGPVVAGLALAGRGGLGALPLLRPGRWVGWAAAHGPVLSLFQALRVSAIAVATLWLSALVLVVVTRVPAVGRLTARGLARLGRSGAWRVALGLSVTGVSVAACGPAPGGVEDVPPVLSWTGSPGGPPPVVGHTQTPAALGGVTPADGVVRSARPPAPPSPPAAAAMASPGTWLVRAGDDLWSIASAEVARSLPSGATLTDRRVATYWLALIEANRALLPVPSDPNVLYPGDRLILPASAPAVTWTRR